MNEVKGDESLCPAVEDEAIEVEHLLAEPKSHHVSVDGVFHLGGLDSNTTQEGDDDLRFEDFHGMLPGVYEVGNIHAANGLSSACEDYLLDAECAEKAPESDCAPCGGSTLDNLSSESRSSDFNGDVGLSKLAKVPVPVAKFENGTLDKVTMCKLHGACRSKCICQTRAKGSMELYRPNSFDSENLDKVESVSKTSAMSCDENEDDMTSNHGLSSRKSPFSFASVHYNKVSPGGQGVKRKRFAGRNLSTRNSVDASEDSNLAMQKRLRKPTKRYIEEVTDLRSKYFKGKQKSTTSKDKRSRVKSHTGHHHIKSRRLKFVSEKGPSNGASIHMPPENRACKGSSKEYASTSWLSSEEEPCTDVSEDDSGTRMRKSADRRKNQRMWTLSEVIKLVDGVSHYGVGQWTNIKRLLFSCSAYRTPIDLRDKWRNLLRAANSWLQSEREDEQKSNQASRPLPKAVLHRVSELASIYPYPRKHVSKNFKHDRSAPPVLRNKGNPPVNVGRRANR